MDTQNWPTHSHNRTRNANLLAAPRTLDGVLSLFLAYFAKQPRTHSQSMHARSHQWPLFHPNFGGNFQPQLTSGILVMMMVSRELLCVARGSLFHQIFRRQITTGRHTYRYTLVVGPRRGHKLQPFQPLRPPAKIISLTKRGWTTETLRKPGAALATSTNWMLVPV